MTPSTQSLVEPSEIAAAFWRYRRRVLIFVLLVAVCTVTAVLFLPRQYGSESQLFVRVGRESVGLDPTATTGQTMTVQTNREIEVQSVLQLLNSRGILEQVVDKVGAEKILVDPNPNFVTSFWSHLSNMKGRLATAMAGESDVPLEEIQRESARELLDDSVKCSVAKNSTVITVSARARSPQLAQEITSALVDTYLYEHARIHRTAGSEEFFKAQADRIGTDLQETLSRLRDTKNQHGFVTIEGQLALIEAHKSEIEKERLRNSRMLAESESSYRSLLDALTDQDALVLASREERPSEAADTMRDTLFELEMKEQEYLSKFTADHPLMQSVSMQVKEARKIHDKVKSFREEPTYAVNPTRQKLEQDLVTAKTRVESLKALDESLSAQEEELLAKLQEVNEQALHIGLLEREAEMLAGNYETYVSNLEQARIDGALQQQQITNVNVAQPASISHRPVSPHNLILLALGGVIALGGSFGLVLGSERINQRLRTAEELEEGLSIPVLMTLPRFANGGSLTPVTSEK